MADGIKPCSVPPKRYAAQFPFASVPDSDAFAPSFAFLCVYSDFRRVGRHRQTYPDRGSFGIPGPGAGWLVAIHRGAAKKGKRKKRKGMQKGRKCDRARTSDAGNGGLTGRLSFHPVKRRLLTLS